jgi:hypothetical protein
MRPAALALPRASRLTRPLAFALAALALCGLGAPARAAVSIAIDKSAQQMTVAVDGVERYRWPVSTGRSGYDTPAGAYTPFRMEAEHYSQEWDDAPMPHSIFFTKIGHAIHGSFETRRLGTAASHGCVRLTPANAATLFALVKAEGMSNTRVTIAGDIRLAARRKPALPDDNTVREPRLPQQREAAREQGGGAPQSIAPDGAPQYGQQRYGAPQYQSRDERYPRPRYGTAQPGYPQPRSVPPEYAQRDYYGSPRYGQPYEGSAQRRMVDPRYYDPRYDPPDYAPYDRPPRYRYAPYSEPW